MFARSPLASGTVVARMGGRVVTREELLALFAAAERDPDRPYVDCLSIEEGFDLVLPARRDNHFGNHSCDPNTWHVDGFTLSARRDIEAGEELRQDNLVIKRAGGEGLPPDQFKEIVGRKAQAAIPEGMPLTKAMLV